MYGWGAKRMICNKKRTRSTLLILKKLTVNRMISLCFKLLCVAFRLCPKTLRLLLSLFGVIILFVFALVPQVLTAHGLCELIHAEHEPSELVHEALICCGLCGIILVEHLEMIWPLGKTAWFY